MCLLVGFDLLFVFGELACRILDCVCGLFSDKLRCLRLKLELLAFAKSSESISICSFPLFVAGVEFHVNRGKEAKRLIII